MRKFEEYQRLLQEFDDLSVHSLEVVQDLLQAQYELIAFVEDHTVLPPAVSGVLSDHMDRLAERIIAFEEGIELVRKNSRRVEWKSQ